MGRLLFQRLRRTSRRCAANLHANALLRLASREYLSFWSARTTSAPGVQVCLPARLHTSDTMRLIASHAATAPRNYQLQSATGACVNWVVRGVISRLCWLGLIAKFKLWLVKSISIL